MIFQEDVVTVLLHSDRPIPPGDLKRLYDSEPWWPERSEQELQRVLDLYPSVGAWSGADLIGFARAVTDTTFRAYIEDLLVLKDFRDGGIGRRIMDLLMESLDDIDVITLFCQRKLVSYYESMGFKEFTRQSVMQKRNSTLRCSSV